MLIDWKDRFKTRFFRSTIATRMTLAYLPLSLIIIFLSLFTLSSLVQMGDLSRDIVQNNMTVIEVMDRMADSLLAQESYGRRYLIMKDENIQALFAVRDREFKELLDRLTGVEGLTDLSEFHRLAELHDRFSGIYRDMFALDASVLKKVEAEKDDELRQVLDDQLLTMKGLGVAAREGLTEKVRQAGRLSAKALYVTAFLSALGVLIGIGAAVMITRSVSRSINQLKLATAKFSERQFDFVPDVKERDEFGMLARSFIAMAQRLARLEVMDLDASPLTRLPGGTAVENVLQQRIENREPIAFCLVDIDNFKSFNDRYGYARGNEVIRNTGRIIENAIAEFGSEDTFLGHIGGDDFVVIAHPEQYAGICESIIERFDKDVVRFYDENDREQGYIVARTRQGVSWEFPLMTVSIAVVSNQDQPDISPIRIGEMAAEIKEHAKNIAGSLYLVNRRRIENGQDVAPHEHI